MKKKLFPLLVLLVLAACKEQKKAEVEPKTTEEVQEVTDRLAGKYPIYDFKGLQPLLEQDNDTTYIINFWATWCEPCVAELPYFEELGKNYADQKVSVVLVDLDMKRAWEKRLLPFLEKRQLTSKVVILDDPKQNTWIPLVDEAWGGGIPATLIYKGDIRQFYEQGFTAEELNTAFQEIHQSE